jgi:phosphoglucomutase
MAELYEKYGYFMEKIESITLKGKDGLAQMAMIMTNLRGNPPVEINNSAVIETRDYKTGVVLKNGQLSPTNLPVSNVLYYEMADGSWFCIRPSGTEPKMMCKGRTKPEAENNLKNLKNWIQRISLHQMQFPL